MLSIVSEIRGRRQGHTLYNFIFGNIVLPQRYRKGTQIRCPTKLNGFAEFIHRILRVIMNWATGWKVQENSRLRRPDMGME